VLPFQKKIEKPSRLTEKIEEDGELDEKQGRGHRRLFP
jgi:hypothetical protein